MMHRVNNRATVFWILTIRATLRAAFIQVTEGQRIAAVPAVGLGAAPFDAMKATGGSNTPLP